MRKSIIVLVSVMLVFTLVGCKSTKVRGEWWNNPPMDTAEMHYEVGVAKGQTVQISREWAKANANQNLAAYINNSIEAIVTTYTNESGEINSDYMQAVQSFESKSKQTATATLSRVSYIFKVMDDGTTYVLAALPTDVLAQQFKDNASSSFSKTEAAEQANQMMQSAIDKYFN
ncbi:MAG: hypothetical protein MJ057_03505 [Sphaerochaetaceae bacterium]|nr:hypothetical protein [Sphaerochaetaceae bacterium]